MPHPILIPESNNALLWENMRAVTDGSPIEDATVTADLLDSAGALLTAGMTLQHTTGGNYYGSTPDDLPITPEEFYFLDYKAERPNGDVGKTRVLCRCSTGAAPLPGSTYEQRLVALRDNILKIIETIVGYSGCPKPDYKIEGFEMDWTGYIDSLYKQLAQVDKTLTDGDFFELATPARGINTDRVGDWL